MILQLLNEYANIHTYAHHSAKDLLKNMNFHVFGHAINFMTMCLRTCKITTDYKIGMQLQIWDLLVTVSFS